ncbi:serine protease HTRA1-like [Anthonomus grandis grandis]|uniref:serine protease HTRA1-like n=1 Tax=Anthonomus grandis grandis TaxID=2921223 RepID=UPI00216681D4|nr:serine protease HTRA1-like [Anthonomus grandis grandis]
MSQYTVDMLCKMYYFCTILAIICAHASAQIGCPKCDPAKCKHVYRCPRHLVLGVANCGCCTSCVIPEGGSCFTTPTGYREGACEQGLTCCEGKCMLICKPDN